MRFLLFSVASLILSQSAVATEIHCVLEETFKGEVRTQTLTLPESTDPHGAISPFTLTKFPSYEGFVALSNRFTVINLVNNETGVATSTQSKAAGDNFVRLQMLLAVNDGAFDTIVIQCGEPTR